jgi:hypothetical protein
MFLWIKGELAQQPWQQRHGCPMGSNLSPAKAMVACSPPEAEFLCRLESTGTLAICARYMDDVGVLIAFDDRDVQSEEQATLRCAEVATMYPAPLVLEPTDLIDGRLKFLESIVQIREGNILVRHCAPTEQSDALYGAAPTRLELHPGTRADAIMRRLTCEWHRASRNSVQEIGLLASVWERCLLLKHRGIPATVVSGSIKAMGDAGGNRDVWDCLHTMLKMAWAAEAIP